MKSNATVKIYNGGKMIKRILEAIDKVFNTMLGRD